MEDTLIPTTETAPSESQTQETTNVPNEDPKSETVNTSRDTVIEVDGKQYKASETTIRKYYNIPLDEPLTDKEYKTLLSSYKQAIHFNNATREVKNKEQQIEQFVKMWQENPKETLKQMFASNDAALRSLAEEIVLEEMEREMLDPKEKELRAIREENERLKKDFEEKQRQAEEARLEQESLQHSQRYEQEIIEVLETSDLPKTENTIKRLAQYKLAFLQKGQDVSFKQISKLVEQDIQEELSILFRNGDIGKITKLLGEDKLKEIRKADLDRVKKMGSPNNATVPIGHNEDDSRKRKTMTPDEFREESRRKLKQALDRNFG